MSHRKFFLIAGLVFVVIAVLRVANRPSAVGRLLPALDVEGWLNGEPPPDDLLGKVVVVDVWATW